MKSSSIGRLAATAVGAGIGGLIVLALSPMARMPSIYFWIIAGFLILAWALAGLIVGSNRLMIVSATVTSLVCFLISFYIWFATKQFMTPRMALVLAAMYGATPGVLLGAIVPAVWKRQIRVRKEIRARKERARD